MYCPNCGNNCKDGARFCPRCGRNLGSAPVQPQPKPAPPVKSVVLVCACVVLAGIIGVLAFLLLTPADGPQPNPGDPSASNGVAAGTATDQVVQAMPRPQVISSPTFVDPADVKAAAQDVDVKSDLSNVINTDQFYLDDEMRGLLSQHSFFVDTRSGAGSREFFETYEQNRYNIVPNFVTVDSMMHTYHLYFAYLQKKVERSQLVPALKDLSVLLLDASIKQLHVLSGTEWEEAAQRNVAFCAVAARLMDPSASAPTAVEGDVSAELALIESASSMTESPILGGQEDYTQYKPRGYYEGDEELERYFRTMMWFGRINFLQSDESMDRSALLLTLALNGDTLDRWSAIYTVTSFFVGASDDNGYYEYRPAVDAAFGEGVTPADLPGKQDGWNTFHALTEQLPPPNINSLIGEFSSDEDGTNQRGFRLMGQRFSLDEAILQQLVNPKVGEDANGGKRTLPDALDVPAALGSDEALRITSERGATAYKNYETNVKALRAVLEDKSETRWSASLYAQWLCTIDPLLTPKPEGYPAFMRTSQWTRKNLQSYLGSYTELKHDTVLYAKQIMAEMGGGPVKERDDRGYVEPEPVVFARLANLVQATSEGLDGYGLLEDEDKANLDLLQQLAQRLESIATKELANELPSDDDFEFIRSYGGQLEHFWQEVYKHESTKERFTARDFPAAVITDIATDGAKGTVLELGTGNVGTIYAIVPVDGQLRIATGSVFTFYQFEQPASDRLTDTQWREMMGLEPNDAGRVAWNSQHSVEDWTHDFAVLPKR